MKAYSYNYVVLSSVLCNTCHVFVCRSLEFTKLLTVRRSPKACSRDWKSPRESSEWECSLHNLIQQNMRNLRRWRGTTNRNLNAQLLTALWGWNELVRENRAEQAVGDRFVSSNDYGSLEFTAVLKVPPMACSRLECDCLTKTWRMSATAHNRTKLWKFNHTIAKTQSSHEVFQIAN